jgi:hypothetical protein
VSPESRKLIEKAEWRGDYDVDVEFEAGAVGERIVQARMFIEEAKKFLLN